MTAESTQMGTSSWYLRQLGIVIRCLGRDIVPITIITVLFTIVGAVAGKTTNSASSSAQLLLTPIPLRDATTDDELSRMIPKAMDVKTASLLCMSDEVISRTRDLLEENETPKIEVKSLQSLKSALHFGITIANDTPYETSYSPVLRLTAKGSSPTEARVIVNTWAEACIELAEKYMENKQQPLSEAFEQRTRQVQASLREADDALEEFRRENNLEHYQERLTALTQLINDTRALRAKTVQQMDLERAKREALVTEQKSEEAKLKLNWTPSGRLAGLLGNQLGVNGDGSQGAPGMLEVEQSNPVYETIRKESALAESSAAGYEAELARIETQLATFEQEFQTLQAEAARVERKDRELLREVETLELVYESAASKYEYARIAAGLQPSEIRLLSEGAEWRMPRFRRAIAIGVSAGVWGFLLAALASVLIHHVIRPALEQAA